MESKTLGSDRNEYNMAKREDCGYTCLWQLRTQRGKRVTDTPYDYVYLRTG